MDSRKSQTATVTPAEPGDYLFYLIQRLWAKKTRAQLKPPTVQTTPQPAPTPSARQPPADPADGRAVHQTFVNSTAYPSTKPALTSGKRRC